MKRIIIPLLLSICIITGCGRNKETPDNESALSGNASTSVNPQQTSQVLQKERHIRPASMQRPAVEQEKRRPAPSEITEKPMLTAEEQLKQYYKERGMEYPQSPKELSDIRRQSERKGAPINRDQTETNTPSQRSVETTDTETNQTAQAYSDADTTPDAEPQPDYSDSEPPELINVTFQPDPVSAGSETKISVQAIDNLSGVETVYGVLTNPSNSAKISFSCPYLEEGGTFTGIINIPTHAETGQWRVSNVRLTDRVHNSKNYNQNSTALRNISLEVKSEDSDTTPPELIDVSLQENKVDGGDAVRIIVQAIDNNSGVARVYGVYASPSGNARISFACVFNTEDRAFVGTVNIPASAESGNWSIEYIRLEDNAKNSILCYPKKYYELFQNAKIDVYSSDSDSLPPELEYVEIYPASVRYREKIEITIRASDVISGVSSVSGRLRSQSGRAFVPFVCSYDSDKDIYRTEIIIQDNMEVGTWQIENILLVDNARNQKNYIHQTEPLIERATFDIVGE